MKLDRMDLTGAAYLVLIGLGAWALWRTAAAARDAAPAVARAVREGAAATLDAVNPASSGNLAYRGASGMVTAATGDPRPLGVQLYEAGERAGAAIDEWIEWGASLANKVNPASADNLAYRGASAAVSRITGDPRPLGVRVYDWLHADTETFTPPPDPVPSPFTGAP